jgi:hypothetical protein
VRVCEEEWLNPNGRLRWRGGRSAANRWGIGIRDPPRISMGYRDYYRGPDLLYAPGKAFFSLWKTS